MEKLTCMIPEENAGQRLDQVLAGLFPDYSRARLQRWIKQGHVTVDGIQMRPRDAVHGGEQVEVVPQQEVEQTFSAEAIPLDIVFEDDYILIINKPPNMVTHPGAGNWRGTLLNALLHHVPALESVPRAGIVHRLDKDTSGLMVVAKTLKAHTHLVKQLQARSVKREYLALVQGQVIAGGTVEGDIGRHHVDRKRMAVVDEGKAAVTHYRVEQRFREHTLLRVSLETGRTHQIRVHMAHIHHPIQGDAVYGGRLKLPRGATPELTSQLRAFKRQALHAVRLGLQHPQTGGDMQWQAPMPDDMQALIDVLQQDTAAARHV